MEIYKIGKIVSKNKNYIILESNFIGNLIYVANSERFIKGENRKIYIYKWENEYQKTTYGFENFRERILFEDLVNISGIGPKTAISVLNESWEKIMLLISEGDWEKLSKFPYISQKTAKQIVFEYQKKYQRIIETMRKNNDEGNDENKDDNNSIQSNLFTGKLDYKVASELEDTLKILGFQKKQIDLAVSSVEPNENFEILVENAIRIISNAREFRNQT
ncbi:Holliday junction branch migration protein RuvA [Mesomycoplasma lagogenitalium]|uniref:Holliday junction branch migration complex subunit RuvA n=1 Tax=Mesomycoplasma lagogenitalium TaxID=171286 RepID=A0ABY8LT28_9BACT|nr:Holliday junction branch migration protein RuvA [Mesomycoplasma lagogenitalium]WGI36399.1 Holliday junction branch migration protein RuvA [Mesomycoplasma lagogenitalium]